MPSLAGAVEWLNSKPLSSAELRGKVVLVKFWTYSCINWHRTLPHVRAWAGKYKEHGLVVIGVHTPEFGFERDLSRVRAATSQLRVDFPVAVDSGHAIWRAFGNAYWPPFFRRRAGRRPPSRFRGRQIRTVRTGYAAAVVEAGAKDVPGDLVRVEGAGTRRSRTGATSSPETYIGHDRGDNFLSRGGMSPPRSGSTSHPGAAAQRLRLDGEWTAGPGAPFRRVRARDRTASMRATCISSWGPWRAASPCRPYPPGRTTAWRLAWRRCRRGQPGMLVEHRLYQLVRQAGPVAEREFEIEFLAPGAEASVFTFG